VNSNLQAPCGDFYVTAEMIENLGRSKSPGEQGRRNPYGVSVVSQSKLDCKYITMCGHQHYNFNGYWHWPFTVVQTFELIFNKRFDDPTDDPRIEFTGYNAELGIAYICRTPDQSPRHRPPRNIIEWCEQHDVMLYYEDCIFEDFDMMVEETAAHERNIMKKICIWVNSLIPENERPVDDAYLEIIREKKANLKRFCNRRFNIIE
jgi:hypothetical protein